MADCTYSEQKRGRCLLPAGHQSINHTCQNDGRLLACARAERDALQKELDLAKPARIDAEAFPEGSLSPAPAALPSKDDLTSWLTNFIAECSQAIKTNRESGQVWIRREDLTRLHTIRNQLLPPETRADSRATDVAHTETYYGKDCPKGKVQVEFVGCDPKERYSNYGWKPVDSAFLEVYVDGQRYRIDVGSFQSSRGAWRRGLHVCGPLDFVIDKHSCNAFDVFHEESQEKSSEQPGRTNQGDSGCVMPGDTRAAPVRCWCASRVLPHGVFQVKDPEGRMHTLRSCLE